MLGSLRSADGRDEQDLVFFGLEALCRDPGPDRSRLHFEPGAQSVFADQPDGARPGGFRLVE
jgi:hypothetical protein